MPVLFKVKEIILLFCVMGVLGCSGGLRRYNPSLLDRTARDGSPEVPQECGAGADYGGVTEGSHVVLRTHRPVEGDRNWVAGMREFVGQSTIVTRQAGVDPVGCPVVRVAQDEGLYYWRVRDLTLVGRGLGPGGGEAVPQRCAQDDEMADFGLIQPGARVILHRHRSVEGDSNWTEEMAEHVGQEVEITDVNGIDTVGCPVVHVNRDNGEWAWRVRDTTLVRAALPQTCERGATEQEHGAVEVGSRVRLGHHRAVRGERNWNAAMEQYVDRVAQVTSLGPPDDQGCAVVHVDIDRGTRPWRVRDLVLLEPSSTGELARSAERGQAPSDGEIPQGCSGSAEAIDYGPIQIGTRVVLGRHRPVGGDTNWDEAMEPHVGQTTRVRRLSGADAAGCPGIRVDADDGEWFWRIRDMHLVQ